MVTCSLLALTVVFAVGITVCVATERDPVLTDTELEGNHYGSCVCQQKCSDQDLANPTVTQLMSALSSLEGKITALSNHQGAPQPSCPKGFVYSDWLKKCYKLFTEQRTWSQAQDFCRNLQPSAELAAAPTHDRLNFIRYLVASDGLYRGDSYWSVWLGGRQEGQEGDWLWRDGMTVAVNWGPDQPNDNGNSDCLGLTYSDDWGTSHLNDLVCTRRHAFVCEYMMK